MKISQFRFDVTPPLGHALLAGLIPPASEIDDELEALGIVIVGCGLPIVLCTVDWAAVANDAHLAWRKALADGAGTSIERVLLHVVHQHNTPFVCLETARILARHPDLPKIVDEAFFEGCLEKSRTAVAQAVTESVPLTAIGADQVKVKRIASNRRFVGPDGKIAVWRSSKSEQPLHRSLPDGLIDPWLKTIAFYSGTARVAVLHFYATHPISYYGDGRVTTDFVGLARRKRQRHDSRCLQMYFTGCAGDVAAGRYNDGSKWAKRALTNRLARAMRSSEKRLRPKPIERLELRTTAIAPTVREGPDTGQLSRRIGDATVDTSIRVFDAFSLAWRRRVENGGTALPVACLHCNDIAIVSLPAECFVAYQLRTQALAPLKFVAVAAYGDGGAWYIPTKSAYQEGGYEIDRTLSAPEVDAMLTAAISALFVGTSTIIPGGDAIVAPASSEVSRFRSVRSQASHLWWHRRALYLDGAFVSRNLIAVARLPSFAVVERDDLIMRGCGRADVSRVASIYAMLNGGRPLQPKLRWLLKAAGRRLCLTAHTRDDGVVGFVLFYFNERDLAERSVHEGFIGVSPKWQGRGISSALRREAIRHFTLTGLRGMSSRISFSNHASMEPSIRLGFKVVDRYHDEQMHEDRAYLKLTFSGFSDSEK